MTSSISPSIGEGFRQSNINYLADWWRFTRVIFTISIGLSRCMFRDESFETTHSSPGTHPISISSLESHRMQFSISNPHDLLSDVWAFWPIYHDIRAKVSLDIEQEDPPSHREKWWRKRCYGKEGFSCHHLLWDLGESREILCKKQNLSLIEFITAQGRL